MLPNNDGLKMDFKFEELPSNTYNLHISQNNIAGFTDRLEALTQAVYLILNIERYEYLIYSWKYGVEFSNLLGKPMSYCISEIQKRIKDALLQDTRISAVDSFQFENQKNKIHTSFIVHSIFGDMEARKEIEI